MLNLEKIGNKIADLRKQNNMLQNELADRLYVTHQAVSKWENGKSIPSIEILYEITKLFQVSIDYLLDDSDIRDDDYETQLRIFPRDSVIRKFINRGHLEKEIDKIFYLLNTAERLQLVEMIVLENLSIPIEAYWHLLSSEERIHVLGLVKKRDTNIDLTSIFQQMTREERRLIGMDFGKGMIHVNFNNKKKE